MPEKQKKTLNQIAVFLALVIAISAGIFAWMFAGARDSVVAVLAMMWTPGIAAILTSLIFGERIGGLGWKPGKARFLGYGYLLPVMVAVAGYGLVWLVGLAEFTSQNVVNYRWAAMLGFSLPTHFLVGFLAKLLLATPVDVFFVLGEEIGWSGFLTPRLAKVLSVPAASLFTGIFWAAWHYPALIGGLYGSGAPLWAALPGFTLVLIGASFLRAALVLKAKSLWPGVMVHAGHNVVLMGIFNEMTVNKGYARYLVSETGVFLGIVYVLIAVGFWKALKASGVASQQ